MDLAIPVEVGFVVGVIQTTVPTEPAAERHIELGVCCDGPFRLVSDHKLTWLSDLCDSMNPILLNDSTSLGILVPVPDQLKNGKILRTTF